MCQAGASVFTMSTGLSKSLGRFRRYEFTYLGLWKVKDMMLLCMLQKDGLLLQAEQKILSTFNSQMSLVRVCIEWEFAAIISLWMFVHLEELKGRFYLQAVRMNCCCCSPDKLSMHGFMVATLLSKFICIYLLLQSTCSNLLL